MLDGLIDHEKGTSYLSSNFEIVGNYYREERDKIAYEKLKYGDTVILVFDPENRFDCNAIKVMSPSRLRHYGFLSKESAMNIRKVIMNTVSDKNMSIDWHGISITATILNTIGTYNARKCLRMQWFQRT